MRKINTPSVWNSTELEAVKRIMIFSSQNLLDLFINEIEGQISDGYWENSRGTEWMWKGTTLYMVGDKTKVYVQGFYGFRKKNFYINKELKECIGDRATEEAGFSSIKEMSAAWNEIADAIKNAESFSSDMYRTYVVEPEARNREKTENSQTYLRNALREKCQDILNVDDYFIHVKGKDGKNDYSYDVQEVINKEVPTESYLKIVKGMYVGSSSIKFPVYTKPEKVAEALNFLNEIEKEFGDTKKFL